MLDAEYELVGLASTSFFASSTIVLADALPDLGWFALTGWEFGDGDWLVMIAGGVLPVLPAILLACHLVWFFGRSTLDIPTPSAAD